MDLDELSTKLRDTMTVERVFGEPLEREGTTVVPVARVRGGGGGGSGEDDDGSRGSGAGFGVDARPVGAYLVRDGEVSFRPAIDVGRVLGAVTAIVAMLAARSIIIARIRARRT